MEKNTEKLKKRVNSKKRVKHLVTYKLVSTKELDYTATLHETTLVHGDLAEWLWTKNTYGTKRCIIEFAIKI